jgi:hypothetical protein
MTQKIFECKYCCQEIQFQETKKITKHLINEHGEIIRGNHSTPNSPFKHRDCQRMGCEGKVQQDAYCDESSHDNLRVIIGWQAGSGAHGSVTEE